MVIYNDKTTKSTVGVLLEVKNPGNKGEMIQKEKLNAKALQELVLYYLRERVDKDNNKIKHLIVTNIYEWFIFDATEFYHHFYDNKKLRKAYTEWATGQKDSSTTDLFYNEIATPAIEAALDKLTYTWFDIREYDKELKKEADSRNLIGLYKLLSPTHLLKQPFANDSNSLNKQFYFELLHIIGLEEVKDGGKKVIRRKEKGKRDEGSLLKNVITIIDGRNRLFELDKPTQYGASHSEQLYAVSLELCITWINRILFLKLLESQLKTYHKGDAGFSFLNSKTVPN
ncbi:MAG: hypothetical protein OEY56_01210 [Cyclobacteriaceae bacterium]|nr:hypothetical protein [Cyclobacteriaceae bacterium]